jgi:CRISPR-associated endonuclease Cas2
LQFGIRTQKSFFECEVDGRELTIIKQIAKRYSQDDDLVTIYTAKQEKFARIGDVKYLEIDDLVF